MRRNQQPPGQCDGSQALNTCCLLLPSSAVSLLKVPTTLSKTPQTRWLKHHKCIVSQFWRPDVQGPGAGRGGFLRGLSPGLAEGSNAPPAPPRAPPHSSSVVVTLRAHIPVVIVLGCNVLFLSGHQPDCLRAHPNGLTLLSL